MKGGRNSSAGPSAPASSWPRMGSPSSCCSRNPTTSTRTRERRSHLIELAPIPVGPAAPPSDLAPGPLQPEAEASDSPPPPPVEEPQQPPVEQPPPTEETTPAVPEPVPTPPPEAAQEPPPSDVSIPTAPPSVAEPAAEPAGPALGRLAEPSSARVARWEQSLVAQIERFKRYPPQAEGRFGVVRVAFSIDRDGRLLRARIITGSGSAILDDEALAIIRRAAPFPIPRPVSPTIGSLLSCQFDMRLRDNIKSSSSDGRSRS